MRRPRFPLVSNLSGEWLEEAPTARYWQRHTRETVQFMRGMECLEKEGIGAYLELGPHPVLVGLGQGWGAGAKAAWVGSLRRGRGEWEQMLESAGRLYVHGVELDWRGFDREYERERVELPTYPFQRQRYWLEEAGQSFFPPKSAPQGAAGGEVLGPSRCLAKWRRSGAERAPAFRATGSGQELRLRKRPKKHRNLPNCSGGLRLPNGSRRSSRGSRRRSHGFCA